MPLHRVPALGASPTVTWHPSKYIIAYCGQTKPGEGASSAWISLFGPGKDSSPVYGLIMEHDRLFGATDRRTWMLSFGEPSDGHSGSRSFSKTAPRSSRSHMSASRSQGNRFSRFGMDTERVDSQLAYYNHREMSLRRVT